MRRHFQSSPTQRRPNQVVGPRRVHRRSFGAFALVIVVALVLLVLLRGQSMLSNALFNPDEAELVAWGRRAQLDLLPYQTYTTTTSLYLWPLFLGVLARLGVPLTLPTAHVLSGLMYAYIACVGWYLFARQHGRVWATIIVLPTTIVLFAGSGSPDFLSLGTELLPLVILMTAAVVLFGPDREVSIGRLAWSSGLCGAAIWAKPQIGPLALAVVVSAVLIRKLEHKSAVDDGQQEANPLVASTVNRDIVVCVAAFLFPFLISFVAIALDGELGAFFHESTVMIFHYSGGANPAGPQGDSSLVARAAGAGGLVANFPFAALWVIGGAIGWEVKSPRRNRKVFLTEAAAFLLPVSMAIATMFLLTHLFDHYANILYGGAMISGVVGCRLARIYTHAAERSSPVSPRVALLFVASLLVVCLAVSQTIYNQVVFVRSYVSTVLFKHHAPAVDAYIEGSTNLQTLCPASSSVQVWGWDAQLYLYYGWQPATRYVDTQWQLFNFGDASYVRAALLVDLEKAPPRCIVEAIGPGSFGGTDSQSTLPGLIRASRSFLARCYKLVPSKTGVDPAQPLAVYVRNDSCRI